MPTTELNTLQEIREHLYEILEQLPLVALSEVVRLVETLRISEYRSTSENDKAKIHAEALAFRAMHHELVSLYQDRYVAVHNGQVVDDDVDRRSLYIRVRAKYGATPVLIRKVAASPEREFHILSPRLERGSL